MGRAKGLHRDEEVRLRDVVSQLCMEAWLVILALLRPAYGRHHDSVWVRVQAVTIAPVIILWVGMAEIVALSVRLAAAQIHTMAVRFE